MSYRNDYKRGRTAAEREAIKAERTQLRRSLGHTALAAAVGLGLTFLVAFIFAYISEIGVVNTVKAYGR